MAGAGFEGGHRRPTIPARDSPALETGRSAAFLKFGEVENPGELELWQDRILLLYLRRRSFPCKNAGLIVAAQGGLVGPNALESQFCGKLRGNRLLHGANLID